MYCPRCATPIWERVSACPRCAFDLPEALWKGDATSSPSEGAPPVHPLVGKTLESRYRIDSFVARGGMGEVLSGVDVRLSRKVAVKLLADEYCRDAEVVARFLREAQSAASLDHPNLVGIYSAGDVMGRPYIVMRYVEGETVGTILSREGRIGAARVVEIAKDVCDGLTHIHARGYIHRDIKPQNLMVEPGGRTVILDFGILRHLDHALTSSGIITGTPAYIAPEQVRDGKRVDGRVDLYALGVTLFEMLTGRLPFFSENAYELLMKHEREAPPRPSSLVQHIPRTLEGVVMKLLAKDPFLRYQRAEEVKDALGLVPADELAPARKPERGARSELPAAPSSGQPGAVLPSLVRAATPLAPPPPLDVDPGSKVSWAPFVWVPILLGVIGMTIGYFVQRSETTYRERKPLAVDIDEPGPGQLPLPEQLLPPSLRKKLREAMERPAGPVDTPAPAPLPSPSLVAPATASPAPVVVPPPPTRGRLIVSSLPPEASLKVDGIAQGAAPQTLDLAPGHYSIELSKTGHKPHREMARVVAGETERVHGALTPMPATLHIATKGNVGEVTIDGMAVGNSQHLTSELTPGLHDVRVRAGRQVQQRRVMLSPGETKTIEFTLEPDATPLSARTRRKR